MDSRISKASRITIQGFIINILLVIFKVTAGVLGRSSAIIADAFHSFSDLSTDIAVFFGVRAADRPADDGHHYGHGKIETLVSMSVSAFLLAVGAKILWDGGHSIARALKGEILSRPDWIVIYAAGISIVLKEWLFRQTARVAKEINSEAVMANAWHHRSDAFSSIGVMVGITGAIVLGDKWHILDPVAAVVVSVFIFKAGVDIFLSSARELVEASLSPDTEREILEIVRSIPGAENPHNLRTRRIGQNIAIEVHVRVDPSLKITKAHNIASNVENSLRQRYGKGTFISVHVEPL